MLSNLLHSLQSSCGDINSVLGFRLKREMLLALAQQSLYPNDPQKRKEVTEKYAKFIIPVSKYGALV